MEQAYLKRSVRDLPYGARVIVEKRMGKQATVLYLGERHQVPVSALDFGVYDGELVKIGDVWVPGRFGKDRVVFPGGLLVKRSALIRSGGRYLLAVSPDVLRGLYPKSVSGLPVKPGKPMEGISAEEILEAFVADHPEASGDVAELKTLLRKFQKVAKQIERVEHSVSEDSVLRSLDEEIQKLQKMYAERVEMLEREELGRTAEEARDEVRSIMSDVISGMQRLGVEILGIRGLIVTAIQKSYKSGTLTTDLIKKALRATGKLSEAEIDWVIEEGRKTLENLEVSIFAPSSSKGSRFVVAGILDTIKRWIGGLVSKVKSWKDRLVGLVRNLADVRRELESLVEEA